MKHSCSSTGSNRSAIVMTRRELTATSPLVHRHTAIGTTFVSKPFTAERASTEGIVHHFPSSAKRMGRMHRRTHRSRPRTTRLRL